MAPARLGLVLDSSVLVAAERAKGTTPDMIQHIRAAVGDVPIIIRALTVAELAHGVHRAEFAGATSTASTVSGRAEGCGPDTSTEATAEIIARIGSEQAAKGINLPLADLIIGACALELGYAIGTHNARDFNRIPGLEVLSV